MRSIGLHLARASVLASALLTACSGGQRPPRARDDDASMRGVGCPSDTSCPDSMRCLTFTTQDGRTDDACEHPCRVDDDCPSGLGCVTIPDRPSKVCR